NVGPALCFAPDVRQYLCAFRKVECETRPGVAAVPAASVQATRLPLQVSFWQQRVRQSRLRGLPGRFLSRCQGRRRAQPRSVAPLEMLSPALPILAAAAVPAALARLSSRETPMRATRPPLHLFAAAQFLFLLL